MVNLQTADNALKDVYLGVLSNQLNTTTNPLLARINQTTSDVWGKEIRKVAPYGINGGIGAGTEDGDLPKSAENFYEQFVLDLKNLYGKIEISDKAIRASENLDGAFVNLLSAEMDGLIRASAFNFGRMLYGNGSGLLAKITTNTTNSITVDKVNNLMEGMVVDIVSEAGVSSETKHNGLRITSIDRKNKTVTLSGFSAEADAVKDKYLCIQNSFGKELTGLEAIFDVSKDLYKVSRSKYSWMNPYIKDIKSESNTKISEIIMQSAIDELDEVADSKVDFIVCSAGVKRNYQESLLTYRSNIDVMNLEGGFKAISFNGIPVVSDRFAPANTMYLLNTKEFNLHQLCDWKWLEGEDGRIIKQVPNKPVYQATLVKYADLICNKPSGQAKIVGIEES